ncbi:MAG: GNAT family N-acetyltransferase [Pseudomonadota bacterium]
MLTYEELRRRTTVVTYLEMHTRPAATRPRPGRAFRITALDRPSPRFYRYMYDAVGRDWGWVSRAQIDDAALGEILDHPATELHLLTEGGVPAGYGELDRRQPGTVKVAYFGLLPEVLGRGLGRWFLEQIVGRAWRSPAGSPPVRRVWVHTCDLDHPRALANYEAAGFHAYDRRTEPAWPAELGSSDAA